VSGTEVVLLALVAVLVALTAPLAAAEAVLARLGIVRALALHEEERRGSAALLWMSEHRAAVLNAVLLLTVMIRVAAATILAVLAIRWGLTAVTAAALALVMANFVLAEVAPRSLAARSLERAGLLLAPPVVAVARVLQPLIRPLVALGGAAGRGRVNAVSPDEEERSSPGTEEETEEVELDEEERAMIHSIFELGDTVCREIMVPRPDMVVVDAGSDLGEVVQVAVESGHSRIPVCEGDRDNVAGVVYAKDLLQRLHDDRMRDDGGQGMGSRWADLVREPAAVGAAAEGAEPVARVGRRTRYAGGRVEADHEVAAAAGQEVHGTSVAVILGRKLAGTWPPGPMRRDDVVAPSCAGHP
jgi:CBS domain containing-hemolysin-like protein